MRASAVFLIFMLAGCATFPDTEARKRAQGMANVPFSTSSAFSGDGDLSLPDTADLPDRLQAHQDRVTRLREAGLSEAERARLQSRDLAL